MTHQLLSFHNFTLQHYFFTFIFLNGLLDTLSIPSRTQKNLLLRTQRQKTAPWIAHTSSLDTFSLFFLTQTQKTLLFQTQMLKRPCSINCSHFKSSYFLSILSTIRLLSWIYSYFGFLGFFTQYSHHPQRCSIKCLSQTEKRG